MRIAISGVGGFMGLRFAERATERGDTVVGLERDERAATKARAPGREIIVGDVCDPKDAARLCEGAEVVFHTAAIVGEGGDFGPYRRVNVGGTRTMVEAARAAGVRQFVHVSSVMVYGFDYPADIGEDGPLRGEDNAYCQTKIESEEAAEKARGELMLTIVRPGDVYGPLSVPWVLRPLQLMKQGLFVLPKDAGLINQVHIDNLCDAVFLAVDKRAAGTFNVTDDAAMPMERYFSRIAELIGKTVRTLPSGLLRPTFGALERVFDFVGKEPPARAVAMRFLQRRNAYSIARAKKTLGYAPRIGFEEGMAGIAAFVREHPEALKA